MNEERKVIQLDVDDILPNRFQPRIKFNEDAILELSESIKEHGVIQPIVVRQIDDKYEIIAGERRYKASLMAGKETIPAIITDLNDRDSAEVALIENVQRKDLTPIEEAVSYKKILDMGYLTQEALADKLGKTQSTVANKLRLLNLDEDVQEALLEEQISERHARSLLRLPIEKQAEVAHKIIAERMTVRKTDEYIKQILNQESKTVMETAQIEKIEQPVAQQKPIGVAVKLKLEPVKEEKAGNNMDQNQFGNINLPTQPIVEEVNSNISQSSMGNNPGFVDVDKIASQATDINVERPVANIDDLLKSDPMATSIPQPITQPEAEEKDELAESLLRPGKFFTFTDIDDDESEGTEKVLTPTNSLNPLFQNPVSNLQETTQQPTTFGSEPNRPNMDTFDFDQFFQTTNPKMNGTQENQETNVGTVTTKPLNVSSTQTSTSVENTTIPTGTLYGVTNVEDVLDETEELDLSGIRMPNVPTQSVAEETGVPSNTETPVQEERIIAPLPNANSYFDFTAPTQSVVEETGVPSNLEAPVQEERIIAPLPNANSYFDFTAPAQSVVEETGVPSNLEAPVQEERIIAPLPNANSYFDFTAPTQSVVEEIDETEEPEGGEPIGQSNNNFIEINPFEPMGNVETIAQNISSTPENRVVVPLPNVNNYFDFGLGTNQSVETTGNISQPTQTYVAGDLKMVINTIRDCAATIEKYGFVVDVEELDFEHTYEVTFKIEKK